jgi:ribosomal protein S18 acetylase RimI-like enzyme
LRSLRKELLNHPDEIFRLLVTMLKKLKMSKKEDRLVIAESTYEILWLSRIMPFSPLKYAVNEGGEEAAKIIYYREADYIHIHDLYVNPKFRKQGMAKALIVEVMGDNRDLEYLRFHTRESNKPIHNLVSFFMRQFSLPEDKLRTETTESFYIDGGKAVLYYMGNPAFILDNKEKVKPVETETEVV